MHALQQNWQSVRHTPHPQPWPLHYPQCNEPCSTCMSDTYTYIRFLRQTDRPTGRASYSTKNSSHFAINLTKWAHIERRSLAFFCCNKNKHPNTQRRYNNHSETTLQNKHHEHFTLFCVYTKFVCLMTLSVTHDYTGRMTPWLKWKDAERNVNGRP